MERIDEGHWPRKVKVAKLETQQGRETPWFGWVHRMKRVLAVREEGMHEATKLSRERSVWRELVRA